mmetsp:Transcript_17505/g.57343  ORF Transcript_17505/g.57343 Transcript_17505/m.57343 type:complete len:114 (-) Transcript_17505:449-790(-)
MSTPIGPPPGSSAQALLPPLPLPFNVPPPSAPEDGVAQSFPVGTVVFLVCIFLVLPMCFIWYRRKCDRNRDVCVFPTCICRFLAVHLWRIELTREYSARQKAEQNQGTAFVHT